MLIRLMGYWTIKSKSLYKKLSQHFAELDTNPEIQSEISDPVFLI